jgi:uncharacterized NAD(P)/FAD-binding protein YdhS
MMGAQRVAVIGGGASGTLAAVHLLREPREHTGLEIELIDREGSFGPGVAYGTGDPLHLLNVPAVRMGAVSGHPEHFHGWLAEHDHEVAEEAFMPRGLYGEYLCDLLASSEAAAADVPVRRRTAAVVAISERPGGNGSGPSGGVVLTLADGSRVEVERAILAPGPLGGGDPIPIPTELREAGHYVADPWAPGALDRARREREVLIVGTGLTMVDVALSLCANERGPRVRAVSRHGLVPRRHRRDLTRIRRFPLPSSSGELAPVMAAILGQIGRVSQQGDDWRDVIDSMRPVTPTLWKALQTEEKRRFLSELQRLWDVHRFRMAPDVADRLEQLQADGRVSFGAGSIVSLEPHGGGARVSLRTLGRHDLDILDVGAIVNCTGAGCDLRRDAPPLLRSLLDAGAARADELGLGLDVAADGALLDAEGRASKRIYAVGALRKGVEWEAIGVTEIRDHSAAAAARIVGSAERAARAAAEAPTLVQPLPSADIGPAGAPLGEAAA